MTIIKGAILEKGEAYYTYMGKIFRAINNKQMNYNWLITDCECYPRSLEYSRLFGQEYFFISGNELTEIINDEDFQFVWGVFSGFNPDIKLDDILKYDLPYADGYEGFWINNVDIQHPLAEVEMVAWDSSFTMMISRDNQIVEDFLSYFSLAEELPK